MFDQFENVLSILREKEPVFSESVSVFSEYKTAI